MAELFLFDSLLGSGSELGNSIGRHLRLQKVSGDHLPERDGFFDHLFGAFRAIRVDGDSAKHAPIGLSRDQLQRPVLPNVEMVQLRIRNEKGNRKVGMKLGKAARLFNFVI